MRFVAVLMTLLIGIDKFVITEKLPDVDKNQAIKKDDPVPQQTGCQCANKCGIEGCQCQMAGNASKCPVAFKRSGLTIDENELQKALQAKSAPLVQWLCFTSPTCQSCIFAESDLAAKLPKLGLTYSDAITSDVRKVDYDSNGDLVKQYNITRLPTYVLVVAGDPLQTMVGNPGAEYLVSAKKSSEKRITPKMAGFFDSFTKVGTIKRSQLNEYLADYARATEWLGKVGKLSFDNQPVTKPANTIYAGLPNWLMANLPANFTIQRDESAPNMPVFRFSPLPEVEWQGVRQTLASVSVKSDRVLFELPSAPDLWLGIEEDVK